MRNGPELPQPPGYAHLELQLGSQKVGLRRGPILGSAGLEREHREVSPVSLLV